MSNSISPPIVSLNGATWDDSMDLKESPELAEGAEWKHWTVKWSAFQRQVLIPTTVTITEYGCETVHSRMSKPTTRLSIFGIRQGQDLKGLRSLNPRAEEKRRASKSQFFIEKKGKILPILLRSSIRMQPFRFVDHTKPSWKIDLGFTGLAKSFVHYQKSLEQTGTSHINECSNTTINQTW